MADKFYELPLTTPRRNKGLNHIIRVMGWVRYDKTIPETKASNRFPHPLRIDHTVTCCAHEEPYTEEFFYALFDTVSQYARQLSTRDSAVFLDNHKAIMAAVDFIAQYNDINTKGPDKSDAWLLKSFSIHSHNERCIEIHCDWAALEPSNPDDDQPQQD